MRGSDSESLRRGAVVVTDAEGHVGRHVVACLDRLPNRVRRVASGDDPTAAVRGAEVAILLTGSLRPPTGGTYEDANLEPIDAALAALRGSTVRRVVYLSYVGADPVADNEYLRAKGRAERAVMRAPSDVVVIRSTHIFGPRDDPGRTVEEFATYGDARVSVLGKGRQAVQPVFVGDVAEAVVRAALDPGVRPGTYELGGPETMTLDDFIAVVDGRRPHDRRLRPFYAFAASHFVHGLTPALVGVLLRESVARPPLARDALGLASLRAPGDVWRSHAPTTNAA
jgi:NADH dehydrogenase